VEVGWTQLAKFEVYNDAKHSGGVSHATPVKRTHMPALALSIARIKASFQHLNVCARQLADCKPV